MKKLEDYVTSIPDFPEPGIIFRDVTTILQDADDSLLLPPFVQPDRAINTQAIEINTFFMIDCF